MSEPAINELLEHLVNSDNGLAQAEVWFTHLSEDAVRLLEPSGSLDRFTKEIDDIIKRIKNAKKELRKASRKEQ